MHISPPTHTHPRLHTLTSKHSHTLAHPSTRIFPNARPFLAAPDTRHIPLLREVSISNTSLPIKHTLKSLNNHLRKTALLMSEIQSITLPSVHLHSPSPAASLPLPLVHNPPSLLPFVFQLIPPPRNPRPFRVYYTHSKSNTARRVTSHCSNTFHP